MIKINPVKILLGLKKENAGLDYLRYYRRYLYCLFIEDAIRFFSWFFGISFFILLIPFFFDFGTLFRFFLIFLFISAISFLGMFFFLKWSKNARIFVFSGYLRNQSRCFADILSAIELSRDTLKEGISEELKKSFIDSVQLKLLENSPDQWIRMENIRKIIRPFSVTVFAVFGLFFIPPKIGLISFNRLMHGSQIEILNVLKIIPEDGRVIYGEPVNIETELIRAGRGGGPIPKLYIKGASGWEEIYGQTKDKKTFFRVDSVTEQIHYQVRWKNLESRIYVLTPVEPPRLTDIKIQIHYPPYTGLEPGVLQDEHQIVVFRGSKVEISARSVKPLEKIELKSSNGVNIPVQLTDEKEIETSFMVYNPFTFYFDMKDREGLSPLQKVNYTIAVKEDSAPQVRLIAPAADLIAGKESRIPFTFEVRDDLGLSSIFLKIEKEGESYRERIMLKKFPSGVTEKIDSADFRMSSLDVAAGEILKMQLEAQDNDTVTGPKSGFSETILVEIQSYEKDHQQIEEELSDFRKDMLDLLGDQTLARVSEDRWKNLPADEKNREINSALEKQSQIMNRTEQVEKNLNKILSEMERDPLSDYALFSEHEAIKNGLESLRNGAMNTAQTKLRENNVEEAGKAQDQAISELERLSNLSEEVYKYGKMRDLIHAADRLNDKGEFLNKKLESNQEMDVQSMKMIQDLLKETMEILSQMQKQIKDLPQELPDEFVNKAAVKKMNIEEIADNAKKVSQALQKGDLQSALQAAKNMLEQVKSIRDTLSKASEDIASWDSSSMSTKMDEDQSALEKIIDRQENLLQETSRLESKRQQMNMELQKKILNELVLRQKKVIAESKSVTDQCRKISDRNRMVEEVLNGFNRVLPKMENVLKEMEQFNIIFSQKWLEEILKELRSAGSAMETYTLLQLSTQTVLMQFSAEINEEKKRIVDLNPKVKMVISEEEDILETLKKPPETQNPFTNEELSELNRLGEEQNRVKEETKKLSSELNSLANKSALVGPEIMESLKAAHSEMTSSAGALNQAKTGTAQESQQKALSHLRKGQESMQGLEQQFGQMKQMGSQGAPELIQRRNQSGGTRGIKTGVVKIPGADDVLPARRFREEILESLKERYPKSQENTIKDYYKRLSQ